MLMLILAVLAQDPTPERGPYVDLSVGEVGMFADTASVRRDANRSAVVLTRIGADGVRSEHDYEFDCAANLYSAASSRILDAQGNVASRQHYQIRPTYRPVTPDVAPIRAVACDGDGDGDGRTMTPVLPD